MFHISKRSQLAPVESPTVNVVIEPFDPAVQKAFRALSNTGQVGELKKGVEKIVVHSVGPGHLGHVEMGPGKNPREIHIYKNHIMDQAKRQFGATQPTPVQLQSAIEAAIMETILHEMHHIGGPQSEGEFLGEAETQTAVKKHFPTASFEEAILKAALDLENIREKFLPNNSVGEPNLEFVAQSMSQKNYYLVKSGVRLLTRGTQTPAMIEIAEAVQFNNKTLKNNAVLKLLGTITYSVGLKSRFDRDLVVALAKWQDINNLKPTGKLDGPTLFKFANDYEELGVSSSGLPRNFGTVIPGQLYRGGMIDGVEQLVELRDKFGIQRIVSLHNNPEIARMCNDIGLEHVPAPLECGASNEPGRKVFGNSVSTFLREKPTYIHCWYGKDRTGGVVARFRTETGWPCEAAYREAKSYGFQDVFVDLIDWFSENCDTPPVDTSKMRSLLEKSTPYTNPEVSVCAGIDFEDRTKKPEVFTFEDEEPKKPSIYDKFDDPVDFVRKYNPKITMPQNVPDYQEVAKGLETPQDMPISHEGIEPGDPEGQYYLLDVSDQVMAKYRTKEQAITNADMSKWAYRIVYDKTGEFADDPIMAIVVAPDAIIWSKSREYLTNLEKQYPIGPFYLFDYWGRVIMTYEDKEQAIRNAERNMYISHINYQPLGNPAHGKTMWRKPPYSEKDTQEQEALDPHLNPVPNDMPFGNPYMDASEHAYTTWADTINSVSPTGILSIPVPIGSTGV
jgi:protein tyrosine/serine phosphatase